MADESGSVDAETLALVKKAIRHEFNLDFVKKVKLEYKGEKLETRLLAFSAYRVYIISTSRTIGKVESSFHILSVQQIESLKPHLINITASDKVYSIKVYQPRDSIEIIAQIQAALKSSFPSGNPDRFRLTLGPAEDAESRQEQLNNLVNTLINADSENEVGPCGGFSKVYACMCDFYGSNYLEEVAWDVDTIYLSHNTKELNLQDFDHLDQKDLIPIIAVLEYNSWFTKLICKSYKLSSDVCDVIIKVIKKSTNLEELVLDGVSLGREFFHKVGLALTSNPKTALHTFDFSNNTMEDRGLSHLTGSFNKPQGLVSLSLVDNGITGKGILSLVSSFKNSKYVQSSLKSLNLSKNPLKAEGVTTLSEFLAQPNALTHLDLSNTDCALDLLFGALMRGCVQNLMHLNLSGNNFTTKKKEITVQQSFNQFFSLAQDLKYVDLSNCKLPSDAVRALFRGFSENENLTDVELDISKNELKSTGVNVLATSLQEVKNIKKLNISDNGFEGDFVILLEGLRKSISIQELLVGQNFKARTSNSSMEALIQLISEENSHITSLSLADSKLKQDLTPLLDALGTNETLVKLDISGNSIGDEGARILAKALQLNSKLRTLVMDKNNISHRGYSDIAAALESNHTLYSIPSPLYDAAQCIKSHGTQCEQHLRKIEAALLRNQSPHKKVAENAYRLQQGLLVASTQQQDIDRLIVHLQDNIFALRNSKDDDVAQEVTVAKHYIQDADKLKQLLLKFHLCTDDSDIEAEFAKLCEKFYQASQDKIKDNHDKMLECAKEVCPYITGKKDVQENMSSLTATNQRISQTFVEGVVLSQAAAAILNRISENKLSVASVMADTLMEMVIRHMEASNERLEQLLKDHRQKKAQAEDQGSGLDATDDVVVAARKAKNRLSSAVLVSGENTEEVPKRHKRRPTVSVKKPKASSISEENIEVEIDLNDAPKVEEDGEVKEKKPSPMVTKKAVPSTAATDFDFSAVEQSSGSLDHLAKSRPRPARGRRLPTRPSNRPQVTNGVDKEEPEENIDTFWAATTDNESMKTETRVQKTAPPRPTPPRPAPKPATKPRPAAKPDESDETTHEKDDKETKKPGWIPKGGINLGLTGFFKKKRDRSGSGNELDQNGTRWYTDGKVDCSPPRVTRSAVKTSDKPTPTVKTSDKDKTTPTTKPKEAKPSVPPPKPAPPRERPLSVLPPKPAVKPRDRTGTAPSSRGRLGSGAVSDITKSAEVKKEEKKQDSSPEKPASARGPPKFGIGLGGMAGGGLLAEMKLRQERGGSTGKTPPETVPKPARRPSAESRNRPDVIRKKSKEEDATVARPRLPTGESNPAPISEEGLVRPSSIKRPRTSSQTPPKPPAKPKDRDHDEHKQENKKNEEEKKKEDEKKEEKGKEEEKKIEKIDVKSEESSKGHVLQLGEDIGESADHSEVNTKEKEKLKLKVKPDETDAELWVKRDMPSPKRSPKSPRKPLSVSPSDTQNIKADTKLMSPISRAGSLPKPWSPSSPTSLSMQRKYSLDEKRFNKDSAKQERTPSTDQQTENKQSETSADDQPPSEGLQKSSSPFKLSKKSPTKQPADELTTHEDNGNTELLDDVKDWLEKDTTSKDDNKPDPLADNKAHPLADNKAHPLADNKPDNVIDDPLGANTLLSAGSTKTRPLSTASDNTTL